MVVPLLKECCMNFAVLLTNRPLCMHLHLIKQVGFIGLILCLFLFSRERLMVALGLDLFAVNDEKFMDMFVAPGAIDTLQNEQQSLQKRQKILHSCLTEFKSVATSL